MRIVAHLLALVVVLAPTVSALGQPQTTSSGAAAVRLRYPRKGGRVVVKGYIGGESHASYVLALRAGDELEVRVVARGNRASFVVSHEEFGEPVAFGTDSDEGRMWVGRVPRTGAYYIAVVAHPAARYTLKVAVRHQGGGQQPAK